MSYFSDPDVVEMLPGFPESVFVLAVAVLGPSEEEELTESRSESAILFDGVISCWVVTTNNQK